MGIQDIKEGSTLIKYFVPYAKCINCQINNKNEPKTLDDENSAELNYNESLNEIYAPNVSQKSAFQIVLIFYVFK